jgi:hypothetical protein
MWWYRFRNVFSSFGGLDESRHFGGKLGERQFSQVLTAKVCVSACSIWRVLERLCGPYVLLTLLSCFPFTSPLPCRIVPSHANRTLEHIVWYMVALNLLILHPGSMETVHAAFLLPIFPSGSWLLWFLFALCHSYYYYYYYYYYQQQQHCYYYYYYYWINPCMLRCLLWHSFV